MLKYGFEKFTFEVIASACTKNDLYALERILIVQFSSFWLHGLGYNLTWGGEGATGNSHTEETRAKMSVARLGKKQSPDHTEAIRIANVGKKRTIETKLKIGANSKLRRGHTMPVKARIAFAMHNEQRKQEANLRKKLAVKQLNFFPDTLCGDIAL